MTDCIISSYARPCGNRPYLQIDGVRIRHSRFVYCQHHKLALEDIEGKVVRHTCDNPQCVNPAHLVLGTQQDNIRDKVERDRQQKGEAVPNSKLTAERVLAIRARVRDDYATLATEFGVSKQTICDIMARRSWRHV